MSVCGTIYFDLGCKYKLNSEHLLEPTENILKLLALNAFLSSVLHTGQVIHTEEPLLWNCE